MTVLKSLFPFVLCQWLVNRTFVPAPHIHYDIVYNQYGSYAFVGLNVQRVGLPLLLWFPTVAYQSFGFSCTVLLADTSYRMEDWRYTMIPRALDPSAPLYFTSYSPERNRLLTSLPPPQGNFLLLVQKMKDLLKLTLSGGKLWVFARKLKIVGRDPDFLA